MLLLQYSICLKSLLASFLPLSLHRCISLRTSTSCPYGHSEHFQMTWLSKALRGLSKCMALFFGRGASPAKRSNILTSVAFQLVWETSLALVVLSTYPSRSSLDVEEMNGLGLIDTDAVVAYCDQMSSGLVKSLHSWARLLGILPNATF